MEKNELNRPSMGQEVLNAMNEGSHSIVPLRGLLDSIVVAASVESLKIDFSKSYLDLQNRVSMVEVVLCLKDNPPSIQNELSKESAAANKEGTMPGPDVVKRKNPDFNLGDDNPNAIMNISDDEKGQAKKSCQSQPTSGIGLSVLLSAKPQLPTAWTCTRARAMSGKKDKSPLFMLLEVNMLLHLLARYPYMDSSFMCIYLCLHNNQSQSYVPN